jgi:hypothetical protein
MAKTIFRKRIGNLLASADVDSFMEKTFRTVDFNGVRMKCRRSGRLHFQALDASDLTT